MLKPGTALRLLFVRLGYKIEPGCPCLETAAWLDGLGWRRSASRRAMLRLKATLFGEARRRGIIPPGTEIGWLPLITYGLRDRVAHARAWLTRRMAAARIA